MSSVFRRISRVSDPPEIVIAIDMKIQESDLLASHRSDYFFVTDTETCFLEFRVTEQDILVLHLRDIKRENMLQNFSVSVHDADMGLLHSKVNTPELLKDSTGDNDLLVGFEAHSRSLKYPIFITCILDIKNAEKSTANPTFIEIQCLRKLSMDFQKILDQSSGTDITLQVDGVDIKASKMILCARSPVFNRMFEHPTSETTLNVVRIEDIKAPIMKELVSFLYTGTKKDHHNFDEACDLYYAADKYEVLSFRDACKSELLNQIKVENACQMLVLANRHGDESFRNDVIQFVKANFKTIVYTESFAELIKDHADIVLLLTRLYVNMD